MALKEDKEQSELLRRVRRACALACAFLRVLFVVVVLAWLLQLLSSLLHLMLPYGLEWLDALEAFIPLDFFVLGLLPAAFIGIAMLILRDIAKGETPFSKKQSRRVRLIACLMFAWVVLGALLSAQVTTFYPDALVSLSYHISDSSTPTLYLDFGVLISAIVCYCISLAFEYGALLQRDSDDIV